MHAFLGLTVTKLSSLKTVRFFWPTLYSTIFINFFITYIQNHNRNKTNTYINQQTTSAWEASSTDNTDEDLIPRRVPVRRTNAASRFNTPATFPVPSAFRTVALVRRCYRSISKSLADDHVAQLTHYVAHCLTFTGASYQSHTSARTVDHTWPPHAGRWSSQR